MANSKTKMEMNQEIHTGMHISRNITINIKLEYKPNLRIAKRDRLIDRNIIGPDGQSAMGSQSHIIISAVGMLSLRCYYLQRTE